MELSASQIKALINMHITNYARRIADLTPQIAALRRQPIHGSIELKRRLAYMEKELVEQEARLASLQDLQRAIQTTEHLTTDSPEA